MLRGALWAPVSKPDPKYPLDVDGEGQQLVHLISAFK